MTITIKGCYTVKPAEPTPNIKISLSESDQINPVTHAPTIYFYRPPPSDYPFSSAIETLKASLSQLLVHFYPLAGRLHWINGGDRLELECNSMGVELYEAESDAVVDDYGDFRPTPELRKLIPLVDYSIPMHELPAILVQLTKFRCGGMSLGFANSHILMDGAAALHFIAEWSRIARGLPLERVPFLDRTTPWQVTNQIPRPNFDHPEFNPLPLLVGRSDDKEERGKESDVVMLKLTKDEVEKIKRQANDDAHHHDTNNNGNGNGNYRRPYSRYEAVTGHIWKSACKAREHKREQVTSLRIAIDVRNRINPPLPKGYFGNAIFPTLATSLAGELMDKPLSYASSRIREAIARMTDEYIRTSIDFVKSLDEVTKYRNFHTLGCTKGTFFGNPNLGVTSWISLPLYGADFGWGEEIFMGPGALGFEGKCFILSGPEGDGSLFVSFRIQVAHVDSFKKFFYEDI